MKSLSLTRPHAVVLVGIPGSGKTFFAEQFTHTFNAPYVSYAVLRSFVSTRKQLTGLLIHELKELSKTKSSIVIDGFAQTRAERNELIKYLKMCGYETLFVWVQTDSDTAYTRIKKLTKLSKDEYTQQAQRFIAPSLTEKPVVISGKHTYATQVKSVLKRLSGPRAEISTHSTPPARSLRDVRRSR